jgi:PAS domain-containing protein
MPVVKPQLVQATADRPAEAIARDLEQVLEQIGEAVIVKDLNAVVTYWNREAATLYGFSAEEAVGQPLHRLHAADLSETGARRTATLSASASAQHRSLTHADSCSARSPSRVMSRCCTEPKNRCALRRRACRRG